MNIKNKCLTGASLLSLAASMGVATDAQAATTSITTATDTNISSDPNADPAVNFTANGNANVAASVNLTGTGTTGVTTNANNQGIITFQGDSTVTGSVGNSSAYLNNVLANGGNTTTVSFSNDVYATTLTANGNVALGGSLYGNAVFTNDAQLNVANNVSGTITTGTNNTGTVSFSSTTTLGGDLGATGTMLKAINFAGNASIGKNIYATNTNVAANATATLTGNVSFNGSLTVAANGTLDLSTYSLTADSGGQVTIASNATLKVSLANSTLAGAINIDANSTANATVIGNNAVVNVNTSGVSGYISNNTQYTLVNANETTDNLLVTTSAITVNDDSAVLSFALSESSNDLILTATRTSGGYQGVVTSSSATYGAATMLNSRGSSSTNASMNSILSYLDNRSTQAALDTAIKDLMPDISGGAVQGALTAVDNAATTATTRLAALRGQTTRAKVRGNTGLSTGGAGTTKGFWMQVFGSSAEQDTTASHDGYDADTMGMSGGFDTKLSQDMVLGASVTFSATDVDNKDDSTGDKQEISSWQATLYGSKNFDRFYLEGILGYGWHNYTSTRTIAANSSTATGEYDGSSFTIGISGGIPMATSSNFTVTPTFGLSYTSLDLDGYTETGANAANLTVNSSEYDNLTMSLGIDLDYAGRLNSIWDYGFGLTLGWNHEFDPDAVQTTASMAGLSNSSFISTGRDPEENTFKISPTLSFESSNNMTISFSYDAATRSDYIRHSGAAKVRWEF
ncbi:autotransporter domain-containing protein [Magnetococcales bacterium HHB-1]